MSKHETSTTTAGAWDLRHPGLIMKGGNGEEMHEFMGMWPLKPDADLVGFANALSREALSGEGLERRSRRRRRMLGLIRTARWFVGTSTEFGPTLYFVSQFDSSLEKYFDDFVLNGKKNLEKIWGTCIGCPTGPNATARDIVQYVARGQIKTLVCYDALPSLNLGQIQKMADWYQKTQKFQRAVYSGDGNLEDKVNAFFSELAKPYEFVRERRRHRHRRRQRAAVHRRPRAVGREEEGRVVPESAAGGSALRHVFEADPAAVAASTLGLRITTMLALTPARTLTSADLKDNLHDIQDNVVAPILMRYGRHIFLKFNDGAKARAWLRNMFKRVNARPKEHGTCFTVNIGFTYEGLKALGLSQRSLDSFPEAFRVGMRGRAQCRGRYRTARAGPLGRWPRRSGHSRDGLDSNRLRARSRRSDADHPRRDGCDRWRGDPLRSGHDGPCA